MVFPHDSFGFSFLVEQASVSHCKQPGADFTVYFGQFTRVYIAVQGYDRILPRIFHILPAGFKPPPGPGKKFFPIACIELLERIRGAGPQRFKDGGGVCGESVFQGQ